MNCFHTGKLILSFMERYLTRIGETLQRLAMSNAVSAGRREVTVAFNFISKRTVFEDNIRHIPRVTVKIKMKDTYLWLL
jgi:hypothetical protein